MEGSESIKLDAVTPESLQNCIYKARLSADATMKTRKMNFSGCYDENKEKNAGKGSGEPTKPVVGSSK